LCCRSDLCWQRCTIGIIVVEAKQNP